MANYQTAKLDDEDEFLISQVVRSVTPENDNYPPSNLSENSEEKGVRRRSRKFAVYNPSNNEKSDQSGLIVGNDTTMVHDKLNHDFIGNKDSWMVHILELQTSLENAMIENNNLKNEVKDLQNAAIECSSISSIREEGDMIRATTIEVTSGESNWENIIIEDGADENVDLTNNKLDENNLSCKKESRLTQLVAYLKMTVVTYIWTFLNDFTSDINENQMEVPVKEEDYSIGRLIDNIKRVQSVVKPYVKASEKVNKVLNWENQSTALIVFVSLFMSAFTGYTVQLAMLAPIYKLTVTYLVVSGLAERFKLFQQKEEEEEEEPHSIGDKVALVKTILHKIQKIAKQIADNLEKLENLIWWRRPEITRKLYIVLWVSFFATLFLPTGLILRMAGMGIVIKIFIINAIFAKYPKVKARYDNLRKLWKTLPTHENLIKLYSKQANTPSSSEKEIQMEKEEMKTRDGLKDRHIRLKFSLSEEERVHPNWRHGKKCNQIYRGNLLSGHKAGKLYLTNAHLCFEKTNSFHDKFVIKFSDIKSIVKAKPFLILPGSGMSIEIFMKDDKTYLFSTIFNRDECYKEILESSLSEGYDWALEK